MSRRCRCSKCLPTSRVLTPTQVSPGQRSLLHIYYLHTHTHTHTHIYVNIPQVSTAFVASSVIFFVYILFYFVCIYTTGQRSLCWDLFVPRPFFIFILIVFCIHIPQVSAASVGSSLSQGLFCFFLKYFLYIHHRSAQPLLRALCPKAGAMSDGKTLKVRIWVYFRRLLFEMIAYAPLIALMKVIVPACNVRYPLALSLSLSLPLSLSPTHNTHTHTLSLSLSSLSFSLSLARARYLSHTQTHTYTHTPQEDAGAAPPRHSRLCLAHARRHRL